MSVLPFFCSVPVFDREKYKLVCCKSDILQRKMRASGFYLVDREEWDFEISDSGMIQLMEASFEGYQIRLHEVDGSVIISKEVPYSRKKDYVEVFTSFDYPVRGIPPEASKAFPLKA